jgi:hypothetical protein
LVRGTASAGHLERFFNRPSPELMVVTTLCQRIRRLFLECFSPGSLYEINSEDEGKTIAALHFVGHTGDVEGKFHQLRQQICRFLVAFPIEHGGYFTNLKL